MFGLMNPGRQDRAFRRAYARCCQHQRRRYGLPSLAFLSFESVLFYLCAVDAGTVSLEEAPDQVCCKLRRLQGKPPAGEQEAARFCNSLGMLLAWIKLSDDLRDGPSLTARFANGLLRGRFRETFAYFRQLDSAFEQRVDALVAEHLAQERPGQTVPLPEYVQPTGRSFAYVCALMAQLPGMEPHREALAGLGERIGMAIIAFDCGMDWHRDQRRGAFNPLPDGEESVRASLALARRHLLQAASEWRSRFGAQAHVGRVLEQVARRVPGECQVPACQRFKSEAEGRLQRWGLGSKRRGVQLNEGLDIAAGVCGFVAIVLAALACCVTSSKKASASQRAKQADLPPGSAPGNADPQAQAAALSATGTGKSKSGSSLECCYCCDLPSGSDCSGCEGAGEACNACDGCNGCDCSC